MAKAKAALTATSALTTFGQVAVLAAMATASKYAPGVVVSPLSPEEVPFDHAKRLLVDVGTHPEVSTEGQAAATDLSAMLEQLEGICAAADGDGQATAGELAAIARADRAEAQRDMLVDQLATAHEELAKAQAAAAGAKAKARQAVSAKPKSPKARKIGEMDNDREAIDAAIAVGDPLEIVFSSGTREIIELDPVEVYPEAFRKVVDGRQLLNVPVLLHGPADGVRVRGAGLVDGEGKQIAFCKFLEPIHLTPGVEFKFDKMIAF